jgi:Uma2 family endonuclease
MGTIAACRTIRDVLTVLGDIPADRVRMQPHPGAARKDDLFNPDNEHCELIDGALVEKPMGFRESLLAMLLGKWILDYLQGQPLGIVTGEQGLIELASDTVLAPDVAFISWERLPNRAIPENPIPAVVPDLAVEIISPSNTAAEMTRKRQEYFQAGVRLVWEIDPRQRTVTTYTDPHSARTLTSADTLTGADVLPGFKLPLADFFAELDRHG